MAVEKIITDAPMEATSIIVSKAINVDGKTIATFQAVWTGSPTGIFTIEASIEGVNFTDLAAGVPSAAAAAGSRLVTIKNMKFQSVRLKYVNSTGTGTLNTHIET